MRIQWTYTVHFLDLLSLCLHSFPEILDLDHLHYHYSEFFFWKVASFSCFLGIYLVPLLHNVRLFHHDYLSVI